MQWISTILALLAVGLSTGAAVACLKRARAPLHWRVELAQLEDEVTKLSTLVRKLNQRATMQERREEEHAPTASVKQRKGETPQEWKQRVREELRAGKLKLKHEV